MHKAGSSRRKRKAFVSSEDEDDKPLFPAKLVPQATAVSPEAPPKISVSPEEPVPQTAKAVQMGDLIVTHVIKGMWKILHLGDRYYACALSNEEWMHYYGGAWTKDEFPSATNLKVIQTPLMQKTTSLRLSTMHSIIVRRCRFGPWCRKE